MDAQKWPFSDLVVDAASLAAGKAFSFSESAALGAAGTKEYIFTTPATGTMHLEVSACALLLLTLDVYEATARAGTNLKTTLNRRRLVATAATATVHEGVGAGADGTLIFSEFSGTAALAGQCIETGRWICARSTKYLIRLTSGAAANQETVKIRWYEA